MRSLVSRHALTVLVVLLSWSAPSTAQQRVQRFVIRPEGVVLDGERFRIHGWNPPSEPGGPESVGLAIDDDPFALDVWAPGCVLRNGWVYVLEESDRGEPYFARFARARAPRAARPARYREPTLVECGDVLRFPDGARAIIEGIEVRNAQVWSVRLRIGDTPVAVPAYPIVMEHALAEDLLAIATITTQRGRLGAPRASLVVTRPSLVIHDAVEGEHVTLRRSEGARLGRLVVHWHGCGHMHLTDGRTRAMCQVSAELGGRSGGNMLDLREPWVWEGHVVEIVSMDGERAVLTLRRVPSHEGR